MAHALGKEVVAEGVETKDQVMLLARMKCDHIQGYYYSRALTPIEFSQFFIKTTVSAATKSIIPMNFEPPRIAVK